MISESQLLKWKKKRKSTYVVFVLLFFLVGLEIGGVEATLWIYISTVLKTGNDKFYYGLIAAAFFIPSLFFPPIVSRFVDKTRRVKFCLIFILSLSIAGSFIYTIHYHPLFLFLGRFLSGFGIAMYPIIISEVARSYEKDDLMRRLPSLNGSRMLGYAFGPCISIFFINTNFKIGPIHVTYVNMIGPILFVMAVFLLLAIVYFTHDLSREYDLKADTMEKSDKESYEISSKSSTLDTVKKIFKSKDTALILAISVLCGILDQTVFHALPIIVISNLRLGYAILDASLVGYAAICAILVFILVYRKMSNREVFYTGVASFLSILIATSILLLLYHRVGNHSTWYILIILAVLSFASFMLSDQTFTVLMCAKLAHSCNQGFLEGIRIFVVQIGRVIGALCVGAYYNHMNICHPAVNILVLLLLVFLMSRKRSLSNPVPVI